MDAANADSYAKKIKDILRLLTVLNLTAYQWPEPACVTDGLKFDFIIVGGGTAGCVIANKLVKQNASVLLIEAGGYPPMESDMTGLLPFLKGSQYNWNFTSICNKETIRYHIDNAIHISQGKMLGGSSSLSYVCYERGYPQVYNEWATITNDTSWNWESVLPYFKKSEKLIDKRILNSPDRKFYGTKGKIKLQKQYYPENDELCNAFEEMGYDCPLDINPDHPLGFTNFMMGIADGIRQTTALKYLSPIKDNPRLHLMINTLATKIIFNEKKVAIGVELCTENGTIMTLKARKEIIISAGTIKSPQILMLSGIGPKDHLENNDIKVLSDLPVGKNFLDNVNSNLFYKMTKAKRHRTQKDPHKYPFGLLEGEVALNKSQRYPDYQVVGVRLGENMTFLALCGSFFSFKDEVCNRISEGLGESELFFVFITYLNPKSKGEILLSNTDPKSKPIIIPGYYKNPIDLENHAKYLADFNRILDTKFFKSLDAKFIDPKFGMCKGIPRGTMDYWKCHAFATSDTSHYIVGTCAMGKVVDSKLNVLGVKKLRVVDASIMPTNVRALTMATVIMIAQKASRIIIKDNYPKKIKSHKYCKSNLTLPIK